MKISGMQLLENYSRIHVLVNASLNARGYVNRITMISPRPTIYKNLKTFRVVFGVRPVMKLSMHTWKNRYSALSMTHVKTKIENHSLLYIST